MVNGVFLIPNDTALDVEVLVGKRGLGAHQRGKLAYKELRGLSHRQLQVGNRNRPIVIVHGIFGIHKRHAERRHGVNAGLDVVLNLSVRFLNENLSVAESCLLRVVSGDGIILAQRIAGYDAIHRELAERTGIEYSRREPSQRTCENKGGERGRCCICGSGGCRCRCGRRCRCRSFLRSSHQGDCHGGGGHRLQYAIRVHHHRRHSS